MDAHHEQTKIVTEYQKDQQPTAGISDFQINLSTIIEQIEQNNDALRRIFYYRK